MTFVETFFQKKDAYIPRSTIIKMDQDYQRYGRTLHLFCEGSDDFEFYRHAVKEVFPNYNVHYYDQKGKANVMKSYEELDWRKYSQSRVFFLIDKDYDDLIGKKGIHAVNFFITTYYSIENYLIQTEIFKIIITRLYGFDLNQSSQEIINKFEKAHSDFIRSLLPITSCILIYRALEADLDLDLVKLDKIFYFEDMQFKVKRYYKPAVYKAKVEDVHINGSEKATLRAVKLKQVLLNETGADPTLMNYSQLYSNFRRLQGLEPKRHVRGKYELWFLFGFLKSLEKHIAVLNAQITTYNSTVGNTEKRPKFNKRLELTDRNIFDVLCSKISCPGDVLSFFRKNKKRENLVYIYLIGHRVFKRICFFMRVKNFGI